MSTDKALADVQPGGRVRLGDEAEKARFEEWITKVYPDRDLEKWPDGKYAYSFAALAWEVWQAALSARQPVTVNESDYVDLPDLFEMGRQPADQECGHIDPSWSLHDRVEFALRDAGFDLDEAAFVAESVSAQQNAAIDPFARQPVTMDDALAAGDGTLHGAIDHWQGRALRAEAELAARQPVGEPIGWYTEDHLTDRSATTYDRTIAERWLAKGWPVYPLYGAPLVLFKELQELRELQAMIGGQADAHG
ncbi:hypothetical protein AB9H29_12215 [Stenotrophomonas sepilia]|uniref:hypothetical protein n=1 Tax=Stenotrophomonas sepilia TaxID=2860290 RepID=UPI003557AECA